MNNIKILKKMLIKASVKYDTPYGSVLINTNAKSVGIFLSGGIDSAVILYLIAKTFFEKSINVPIQPVTVRRGNPTDITKFDRVDIYPYVEKIIKYTREKFPSVVIYDTIKEEANYWWAAKHTDGRNISSYTSAQETLSNFLEWKFARPEIVKNTNSQKGHDILYCEYYGTTKNPPKDSGVPQSEESHRDNIFNYITGSSTTIERGITDFIALYAPFRNADKRITMWLANNLGILKDLLLITRSCEGGPVETANFTKECMKCWWCLERHWALHNYKIEKNDK
jgi:hypothetical protein